MSCKYCFLTAPTVYTSQELDVKSICLKCVRKKHPERAAGSTFLFPSDVIAFDNPRMT